MAPEQDREKTSAPRETTRPLSKPAGNPLTALRWAGWALIGVSLIIAFGAFGYSLYSWGLAIEAYIRLTYITQGAAVALAMVGAVFAFRHHRAAVPIFIVAVDCFAVSVILELVSIWLL